MIKERELRSSPDVPIQSVLSAYVGQDSMTNKELYDQLSLDLGLDPVFAESKAPVGKSGAPHNLCHRKVRWHQQSLRKLGLLERMDRGKWRLSEKAKADLTQAPKKQVLIAFNTALGCALWANSEDVFSDLQDEIALIFTSPPYPLTNQRQYGNKAQQVYVEWLCQMLEPLIKKLRPGGNLVLNLSSDIFEPGLPSRSTYLERVTIALCDMGLSLMDRFVWVNPSKPPGPIQYASLQRTQCNVGWEPVLWFTNDPEKVIADNRRVLEPHSEQHLKLLRQGGEKRAAVYSGGAYRVRPGSFGNPTDGRIPRNILTIPHRDVDQDPAREFARMHGLPEHPAPMPLKLAEFFVKFLSDFNDLVVDLFGGYATTGKAAELHGRRWLVVERCREYIASAAERFRSCPGFEAA